jgi:Dolichyl-phosphate-mannose-protein mannosyltransferase
MTRRDASSAPPGRRGPPPRPTPTRRAYRPFSRPEADTVMLPPVTAEPEARPGERGPAGRPGRPAGRPAAGQPAERTRVLVPRRGRRELERSPFPRPSPRRIWVSRAVLVAILAVQAALSLRMHNTAFEDEALYLTAGHYELAHLLYGVPLPQDYASFFSGSPVLYPILGALADTAGGLAAARLVSLAAMLTTTALLYSLTRRLFNERIGLCAAVIFSVTESAIFLGNFATYDAPALCLLAVAAWIVVRTATVRWPVYLAAAPVAALAVGTKYAAALFVPTIVAMAALAAWPYQGKRALIRSVALGVAIAGLLAGALWLAGSGYVAAVTSTTTARQHGTTPIGVLLRDCLLWGALPFALAVIGSVAYAMEARTEPGERIAPPGGRVHRIVLGVVLTGTALLAPLDQIHLHTDVSFQKHIGFGLFFAAPMAGIGLARIIGPHFHRAQFGVAVWGGCLLLGMVQAGHLYDSWPNGRPLVAELSRYLAPHAHYLVEVSEVPSYYLMYNPDARASQFSSTYFISYTEQNGTTLTGDAGYEQAIRAGYFRVIAYDNTVTLPLDHILARMLMNDPQYRLAATLANSDGQGTYYVWVKR